MEIEISLGGIRINGMTAEQNNRHRRYQIREELRDNLLFDALSMEYGLTPEERLFVVLGSGRLEEMNKRWIADLYAACGCRAEARSIYKSVGHWRKVGDMALAEGDLDGALAEFRKPAHDDKEKAFRGGPDHDRIMAVTFRQRHWFDFIAAFRAAEFDPLNERHVVFGRTAKSAAPWARWLAIAATRARLADDPALARDAERALLLAPDAWCQILDWAAALTNDDLAAEDTKLLSGQLKTPVSSLADATARGATERAKVLAAWIQDAPDGLDRARADFKAWMDTGDRPALDRAVAWVTGGVLFEFTKTAFFELSDRRKTLEGPPERVCEAYRAHPQLMRLGIGHYLTLKIQADIPFTGEDLLGGVFQALAWPTREFEPKSEHDISFGRLKSCEEWAEVRLEDWSQSEEGKAILARVCAALKKLRGFRATDIRRETPWVQVMDKAIAWLGRRWTEEIGVAVWQSEMQAFQLLKRSFKGYKVVQHDEPHWLSPQHLDIHIPELRVAVEYMGLQHYEPVEVFGGQEAFRRTVERDRRKAELCRAAGVALEYIRHDEQIGARVYEIAARYGGTPIVARPRPKILTKKKSK